MKRMNVCYSDPNWVLFMSDMVDPTSDKGLCLNAYYLYVMDTKKGKPRKIESTKSWNKALKQYQENGKWPD
jgi:hypothetical protein